MKPRPDSLGFLLYMNFKHMTVIQNNIWFRQVCSREKYVLSAGDFSENHQSAGWQQENNMET